MSPALEAAVRLAARAREEGRLRTHARFLAPERLQGKRIGSVLPPQLVYDFKELYAMKISRMKILTTLHIGQTTFYRLLKHLKRRK